MSLEYCIDCGTARIVFVREDDMDKRALCRACNGVVLRAGRDDVQTILKNLDY